MATTNPQVTIEVPVRQISSTLSLQQSTPEVQVSDIERITKIVLAEADQAQLKETFETLSKNMSSLPATFTRANDGSIAAIMFGAGRLVKTLNKDAQGKMVSVVLTGLEIGSLELTKTFQRNGDGLLIGYFYSQKTI